jgi:hypothetical protein
MAERGRHKCRDRQPVAHVGIGRRDRKRACGQRRREACRGRRERQDHTGSGSQHKDHGERATGGHEDRACKSRADFVERGLAPSVRSVAKTARFRRERRADSATCAAPMLSFEG